MLLLLGFPLPQDDGLLVQVAVALAQLVLLDHGYVQRQRLQVEHV